MAAICARVGTLSSTSGRVSLTLTESYPIAFSKPSPTCPHLVGRRFFSQRSQQRPRFSSRLRAALRDSKVQWYPIPVALGVGFLGLVQFYKVSTRESERRKEENGDSSAKKRAKIRPEGPWYVPFMTVAAGINSTDELHSGKCRSCLPCH